MNCLYGLANIFANAFFIIAIVSNCLRWLYLIVLTQKEKQLSKKVKAALLVTLILMVLFVAYISAIKSICMCNDQYDKLYLLSLQLYLVMTLICFDSAFLIYAYACCFFIRFYRRLMRDKIKNNQTNAAK